MFSPSKYIYTCLFCFAVHALYTVEPPNKGHVGTRSSVRVLSSIERCALFGVSFIGGSTVLCILNRRVDWRAKQAYNSRTLRTIFLYIYISIYFTAMPYRNF